MKLDPKTTAVLSLDVQPGIIAMAEGAKTALPNASIAAEAARKAGCLFLHIGIGFEPGYPEVSPKHPRFPMLKEKGLFLKGSESAAIDPSIFKSGDTIIYKHRVSAFAGNSLEMILRAKGIDTVVMFGFSTSGVVLSTIRQASDLDFKCIVVKDACFDRDEEVHRVLIEKVFANQGIVITAQELKTALS